MASSDLDPVFVKALKLLQSRSKDSYFQLKQMYDEVVAQRRTDSAVKRVIQYSLFRLRFLLKRCFYLDLPFLDVAGLELPLYGLKIRCIMFSKDAECILNCVLISLALVYFYYSSFIAVVLLSLFLLVVLCFILWHYFAVRLFIVQIWHCAKLLMQENDGDLKPFGNGNGSYVAGTDTAKKRELDMANLEKVLYCFSQYDVHELCFLCTFV